MLHGMDHMEASCVFCVKVGTLHQFEQSKFCFLTVTTLGIVMLTVQVDSIFCVSVMYDPGHLGRQTSRVVLSVEEYPVYMLQ
jgi:hypothetical protein